MSSEEILEQMNNAKAKYKQAAIELCETAIKLLPVGAVVTVQLGNSNPFMCEVTGHNDSWWCSPGKIHGTNMHTGKRREFLASDLVLGNGVSETQSRYMRG